jgi:hypothetical protein
LPDVRAITPEIGEQKNHRATSVAQSAKHTATGAET